MKINLSKHQRYAALAAAAIILVVLYLQIEDEGFHGYGWVLALLSAVALVIVGIGPVGSASASVAQAPSKPSTTKTKEELEGMHKQLRDNAEVLAIEVEERAKIIAQDMAASLPPGLRLVGADGAPSPVEAGLDSFVRERSLLFSLGLVGIRQAKDHHLYVTGIEYKDTEKRVFDVMARESIAGLMSMGLPVDKDKLLPQLLGELQAIRKCVVQAAEARNRGETDVTTPLTAWLSGHGLKISNEAIIKTALQKGNV